MTDLLLIALFVLCQILGVAFRYHPGVRQDLQAPL
jgi:hypothetical protein